MNNKRITRFVRRQDLCKVFLVIGVVLANTRFENFSDQKEDYSCYTNLDYTEWVIEEESNEEHTCVFSRLQCDVSAAENHSSYRLRSHIYANNAYNTLILILHKALISNACYPFRIISILQLYNNRHSSSETEPPVSDRPVPV
jgi:hypothetical protein